MTAGDPTRADIERAAAKLFGPAGARAFCDRVERAALLAALSISQEAYAEDQIQKRTGCWAVAPEGDKEVLVERASGRAMDHPDGTPLEQYWTPYKHKDEDLADELLELFRGVENYRGNYIGFTHLDGGGDMTVGFGHYLPEVEDALLLRDHFVLKVGGAPASDKVLSDDFARVKAQGATHNARLADSETDAKFKENRAEKLAIDDIETKLREIRGEDEFDAFDTFPFEAKLAVLDMAYNMGARGAAENQKGGRFGEAVRARNWRRAAELSDRGRDVQVERNVQIRDWFLGAAKKEPCWVQGKDHTRVRPVIVWGRGANTALTVEPGRIVL